MSRLLSQEEVDALLSSFGEELPPLQETGEQPFDLRAPLMLAGERLALVQAACEKIAGRVAESLTLLLITDTPIRGDFTGLVQQPASTILGTLTPGEPLGLLLDERGEPIGGVSFQAELAVSLVDRLQSGEGTGQSEPRPLSLIEGKLFEGALDRLARYLDKHTPLGPIKAGGLDVDPIFGRLAQRGGTLATASFRMETPAGEATCRLMMTPVLINRLVAETTVQSTGEPSIDLLNSLKEAPVHMVPVITGATLQVSDLKRMRPGHVVQLEISEHEMLGLRFNGALLARGRLTRTADRRLFEIEEFVPPRR